MRLSGQILGFLAMNAAFEKLFKRPGMSIDTLTYGQIVSMRKKNNRGRIIKRLKGTLGKRYKRH